MTRRRGGPTLGRSGGQQPGTTALAKRMAVAGRRWRDGGGLGDVLGKEEGGGLGVGKGQDLAGGLGPKFEFELNIVNLK
jgi:hypothetical protein